MQSNLRRVGLLNNETERKRITANHFSCQSLEVAKHYSRSKREKRKRKNQEAWRRWGKCFVIKNLLCMTYCQFKCIGYNFNFLYRSPAEKLMLRKKPINKSWDKTNLTRPTKCSTTTKIKSRLYIQKCSCAMSIQNNKLKWLWREESNTWKKKLIFSGRNLKNKKWKSTTKDSGRSWKKNTIKRWRTLKMYRNS